MVGRLLPGRLRERLKDHLRRVTREPGEKTFFSQFGEDACLFTYFVSRCYTKYHTHTRIDKGFYVDVGAYDPVAISNTYLFYTHGWRGINIDANPGVMERFRDMRPGDINLNIAVSNRTETMDFYLFGPGSVYNTLDKDAARAAEVKLGRRAAVVPVMAQPLRGILDAHVPKGQSIDFLSVDAEGHDLAVLQSNDWNRHRPQLVVAELDSHDIRQVTGSDLVQFMESVGYQVRFWSPPSVILVAT